jgi:hypothetical protein
MAGAAIHETKDDIFGSGLVVGCGMAGCLAEQALQGHPAKPHRRIPKQSATGHWKRGTDRAGRGNFDGVFHWFFI